jgi:hypothetical protein
MSTTPSPQAGRAPVVPSSVVVHAVVAPSVVVPSVVAAALVLGSSLVDDTSSVLALDELSAALVDDGSPLLPSLLLLAAPLVVLGPESSSVASLVNPNVAPSAVRPSPPPAHPHALATSETTTTPRPPDRPDITRNPTADRPAARLCHCHMHAHAHAHHRTGRRAACAHTVRITFVAAAPPRS